MMPGMGADSPHDANCHGTQQQSCTAHLELPQGVGSLNLILQVRAECLGMLLSTAPECSYAMPADKLEYIWAACNS